MSSRSHAPTTVSPRAATGAASSRCRNSTPSWASTAAPQSPSARAPATASSMPYASKRTHPAAARTGTVSASASTRCPRRGPAAGCRRASRRPCATTAAHHSTRSSSAHVAAVPYVSHSRTAVTAAADQNSRRRPRIR
ncbi:hypothetical protein KVH31_03530 [Streptomyces olivaceus]|uniref:hypothetical protein n=1 Tax=Streptomyces olivaceus TaxID=47716 RepID=UPI001CC9B788|nr:hypothetical protein [Streptomyces olivaceus]MBZ6205579.1 hypothetical protein [Streptomyces olivaceus]